MCDTKTKTKKTIQKNTVMKPAAGERCHINYSTYYWQSLKTGAGCSCLPTTDINHHWGQGNKGTHTKQLVSVSLPARETLQAANTFRWMTNGDSENNRCPERMQAVHHHTVQSVLFMVRTCA